VPSGLGPSPTVLGASQASPGTPASKSGLQTHRSANDGLDDGSGELHGALGDGSTLVIAGDMDLPCSNVRSGCTLMSDDMAELSPRPTDMEMRSPLNRSEIESGEDMSDDLDSSMSSVDNFHAVVNRLPSMTKASTLDGAASWCGREAWIEMKEEEEEFQKGFHGGVLAPKRTGRILWDVAWCFFCALELYLLPGQAVLGWNSIDVMVAISLVGPESSLGVSIAFPSVTFPSRFRQRFHYQSVKGSVTCPSTFL